MKKQFLILCIAGLASLSHAQTGYYGTPGGNYYNYGNPGVSYSGGQTTYSYGNGRGSHYSGSHHGYGRGTASHLPPAGYNCSTPGYGYGGNCAPGIPAHNCGGYCNASYHVNQIRVYTAMNPGHHFYWRITEGLCWVPGYYASGPYGCQTWIEGQWVWREIGRDRIFGCH